MSLMARKKQISEQDELDMVAQYESGSSIYEIGKRVGYAPQTIHKVLRRRDVAMRTRGGRPNGIAAKTSNGIVHRTLTSDERQRVVDQYADRVRVADIARGLTTSLGTIYDVLRQEGVPLRGKGQQPYLPTDAERAEMERRYREGQGPTGIAAAMGRGAGTVRRILSESGIDPKGGPRKGPLAPGWKGGRVKWSGGYMAVWVAEDDPMREMARSDGYVPEHRLVMARAISRPLAKHETVHHINGVRDDNRLENLQLRLGRHGKGVVMRCLDCGGHNIEATEIADAS